MNYTWVDGIKGCAKITPTKFEDYRGEYVETYNEKAYEEAFDDIFFVEDDISVSRKNVFRGMHGDGKTWKLIQCLHGEIFLGVLDTNTKAYRHWILNDKNRTQILVPPQCVNGHYVLSNKAIFSYKQSEYYGHEQITIAPNDPMYKMFWPFIWSNTTPIMSQRDAEGYMIVSNNIYYTTTKGVSR